MAMTSTACTVYFAVYLFKYNILQIIKCQCRVRGKIYERVTV